MDTKSWIKDRLQWVEATDPEAMETAAKLYEKCADQIAVIEERLGENVRLMVHRVPSIRRRSGYMQNRLPGSVLRFAITITKGAPDRAHEWFSWYTAVEVHAALSGIALGLQLGLKRVEDLARGRANERIQRVAQVCLEEIQQGEREAADAADQ
jgi:hypothetical protein